MFFIGSAAIFTMNLLRILTLILVYLNLGKNYFDSLHLLMWHLVSTLFVVLVWIFLTSNFRVKNIPLLSDIRWLLKEI
jgi:exosortase/archaeosortase family protein